MKIKKLFLIAATSTALFTSGASFAETDSFYLKAEGGASLLNTQKLSKTDKFDAMTLKPNTAAILGFGPGYHLMDNVRTDLTLNFLINPKFSGDKNLRKSEDHGQEEKIHNQFEGQVISLLLNAYADYDLGMAKIFAGGGGGVAQLKEKITCKSTEDGKTKEFETMTKDTAYNFAYQLSAGASFNISDGVNVDLTYSWRDYGEIGSKEKQGDNAKDNKIDVRPYKYRGHNLMVGLRFDI